MKPDQDKRPILAISQLEEILEGGCMNPDCTHKNHTEVFLKQSCHPKAGVFVRYVKGSGVVMLECRECKKPVADVAVALVPINHLG